MVKLLALSLAISLPTAFVLTLLSTPILWRLEPILGIELAGHSGPSDWIFEANMVALTLLVFVLLRWLVGTLSSKKQ